MAWFSTEGFDKIAAKMVKCPKCGTMNHAGAHKCKNCGHVFGGSEKKANMVGSTALNLSKKVGQFTRGAATKAPTVNPNYTTNITTQNTQMPALRKLKNALDKPKPTGSAKPAPMTPPNIAAPQTATGGQQMSPGAALNKKMEELMRKYDTQNSTLRQSFNRELGQIKTSAATATKTDPALWERSKAEAKAKMGGKHSARAMQLATQIYKKKGGGYSGAKPTAKNNSLKKWTKQKWQWSKEKKAAEGKGVYLPAAKIERLKSSPEGQKKLRSAERKKAMATKQGEQYSSHGLAANTSLKKEAMHCTSGPKKKVKKAVKKMSKKASVRTDVLNAFKAEGGALGIPALKKRTKNRDYKLVDQEVKKLMQEGKVVKHPHGDLYTPMGKTAGAERVGEAAIIGLGSFMGRRGRKAAVPFAEGYNRFRMFPVNEKKVAKAVETVLKKEIPGTKGKHLPGMNKKKAEMLAKKIGKGAGSAAVQLSHPETMIELLLPFSPVHMPITAMAKKRMTGLEDVSLKHKVLAKFRRSKQALKDNEKAIKRTAAGAAGGAATGLAASQVLKKEASVEYRGKTFPGYGKPIPSDRKNKKKMVLVKRGDKVKVVHFGHKGYEDFTQHKDKKRRKNYLTRSAGIKNKSGQLTKNDPFSPNYWARRELW